MRGMLSAPHGQVTHTFIPRRSHSIPANRILRSTYLEGQGFALIRFSQAIRECWGK